MITINMKWAICVLIHLLILESTSHSVIYKKLLMHNAINNSSYNSLELDLETKNLFLAIQTCNLHPWCVSLCQLDDNNYRLWDLKLHPATVMLNGYTGDNPDLRSCYTRLIANMLSHPDATGSFSSMSRGRDFNKLLSGSWSGKLVDCFLTGNEPYPYIYFDLSRIQSISKVRVQGQNNYRIFNYFADLEIRAGINQPKNKGDFRNLQLIGKLNGPAPYEKYVLESFITQPIAAQFVSIQMVTRKKEKLSICGVEIL